MFKCPKILSCDRRASSSVRAGERGATLAELLVVLTIMSILAAVAVPFAETTVQRNKELELRETLRDVRTALDRFHSDWRAEAFDAPEGISENGFPGDLQLLVDGLVDDEGQTRRYLRRLPRNPFAPRGASYEDQWLFLGYADPPDARVWNGEDIFDLRPVAAKTALDGTSIAHW